MLPGSYNNYVVCRRTGNRLPESETGIGNEQAATARLQTGWMGCAVENCSQRRKQRLLIHGRRTYFPERNTIMDGHRIPWKIEVKYLEVVIDGSFQKALPRSKEKSHRRKDYAIAPHTKETPTKYMFQYDWSDITSCCMSRGFKAFTKLGNHSSPSENYLITITDS